MEIALEENYAVNIILPDGTRAFDNEPFPAIPNPARPFPALYIRVVFDDNLSIAARSINQSNPFWSKKMVFVVESFVVRLTILSVVF